MKTVRLKKESFVYDRDGNPLQKMYECNEPGDQSGEYVRAEVARELEAEVARLKAQLEYTKSHWTCAFCGEKTETKDLIEMADHITKCEKHPMAKAVECAMHFEKMVIELRDAVAWYIECDATYYIQIEAAILYGLPHLTAKALTNFRRFGGPHLLSVKLDAESNLKRLAGVE